MSIASQRQVEEIEVQAPMTDEEVRVEYERRRRPPKAAALKTVPEVLAQLDAVDERLASDGAPLATCDELTVDALEDLMANRTCALRVPGFAGTALCNELNAWIARGAETRWGGTDTSYSAGIPVNALSWSAEDALAYFRGARPSIRALRNACTQGMSPIDRLRLELDETWPMGANVSSDNPYRRKMFVGLSRTMRPEQLLDGISREEGIIHADSSVFIEASQGSFSANVYLEVPPLGGEVSVFPLAMKQSEYLQNLVRVVGYLLEHAFDDEHRDRVQRKLHALLPAPVTIKPAVGDLIILNTGRPHAVRGFPEGKRVTLQAFIRHHHGKPLQLFS